VKTGALDDDEKRNVQLSTEFLPLEQDDAENPIVGEKNEVTFNGCSRFLDSAR
jgi:hypothetical protein